MGCKATISTEKTPVAPDLTTRGLSAQSGSTTSTYKRSCDELDLDNCCCSPPSGGESPKELIKFFKALSLSGQVIAHDREGTIRKGTF